MALHIVRSLGQAFDVCHKLNPKPKKKKDDENTEEDAPPTDTNEKEPPEKTAEGEEGEVAETPETWKQFSTDLDAAMGKMTVFEETTLSTELGFDPFATPLPTTGALGNGIDPFQPPVTHPPLAVGNSTTLPDFPSGVDPSTVSVPPAHMHLLAGTPAANGQVLFSIIDADIL